MRKRKRNRIQESSIVSGINQQSEIFTIYRKISIFFDNFPIIQEKRETFSPTFDEWKPFITLPICLHKVIKVYMYFSNYILFLKTDILSKSTTEVSGNEQCFCRFKNLVDRKSVRNLEGNKEMPIGIDKIECTIYGKDGQFLSNENYMLLKPYEQIYWNLGNAQTEKNIEVEIRFMYKFEKKRKVRLNCLENFLKNEEFNDISLICIDDKGKDKVICASSTVLSTFSSVFKTMFEGETLENQTKEVRITDIDHVTMQKFIRYLYTRKVEEFEDAEAMLYVAEKYDVEELKRLCYNQIKRDLSIENVWDIINLAYFYNNEMLIYECTGFLYYSFRKVKAEEDFKNLDLELQKKILQYKRYVFGRVKINCLEEQMVKTTCPIFKQE